MAEAGDGAGGGTGVDDCDGVDDGDGLGGGMGAEGDGSREYLLGPATTRVHARQAGSTGELFSEIFEISLNELTGGPPAVVGSAIVSWCWAVDVVLGGWQVEDEDDKC